jgi:hypothetical protein
MGEMELNGVTVDTLENFRLYLVEGRKLSLKTARNVIDGSLRAMFRDAGRRIDRNPFNDLPANWWPRLPNVNPIRTLKKSVTNPEILPRATVTLGVCFCLFPVLYRNQAE